MGRPQKQTASYFKHFTDTGGRTRFILESRWGNDGYAFWFKLLETLAAKDGHYINLSSETEYEYFASKMRIPNETIEEIIKVLVDMENIDRELWETRRVIWCQSLVDNLAELYSKRSTSLPTKPDAVSFEEHTAVSVPATEKKAEEPAKEKPKKKRKTKAEKEAESREGKVEYAEFVYMTEAEHQKLIDKYGEGKVARQIEVLDNYKGSHGKTYSSDYRTILSWVAERVEEEYRRGGGNGAGNTWGKGGGATGNPPGRNFEPSTGFRDSNNTGGGESPGDQDADGATGGGNV